MLRKTLITASALAVAVGGLVGGTALSASAKTATITATSGNVNCNITAKAKLAPSLKNNWVQSDHSSDPNAAVRAIPNTTFASNGPVQTNAKAKSTSCSGTASQGSVHATVTGAKISLTNDPAHPGSSNPATCTAFLSNDPPSTAQYIVTVRWKASGAKLIDTTIKGAGIAPAGLGFAITGGTVSGSFAGGSSNAQANVDGATITTVTAGPPSSAHPDTGACQPRLKLKAATAKKPASASLKSPKGFKKIGVPSGTFHIQAP
jgi:hypothetical protein